MATGARSRPVIDASTTAVTISVPPAKVMTVSASPRNSQTQSGPRITSRSENSVICTADTSRAPRVKRTAGRAKRDAPMNRIRSASVGYS
jgi:hypothetical protein